MDDCFLLRFRLSSLAQVLVGADGALLAANGAFADLAGVPADSLAGRAVADLLEPAGRGRAPLEQLLAGEREWAVAPHRLRRASGAPLPVTVDAVLLRAGPGGERVVAAFVLAGGRRPTGGDRPAGGDRSEGSDRPAGGGTGGPAYAAAAQLAWQRVHDPLTGLANRTLLAERIEAAHRRGGGDAAPVAALFLDLDEFSSVNDLHGHDVGDDVLAAVARRLDEAVRPEDTVARFAGDEFVVLCEDLPADAAVAAARRLVDAVRAPLRVGDREVRVEATVGVALAPPHDVRQVVRFAAHAAYDAKVDRSDRVRVFADELRERSSRRALLATVLVGAVRARAVDLRYQPIVALDTGRLLGVEAVARWSDPRLGAVAPAEAMAVAEDIGVSTFLDEVALRRLLAEVGALRATDALPPDIWLALSLAPASVARADFAGLVHDAVRAAGLLPSSVLVEVRESAIATAPGLADRLGGFRELGMEVVVDGFGAGTGTLASLRGLPAGAVRLDRGVTGAVAGSGDGLAVAAALVDLARTMRLRVMAEAVDDPEQAAVLHRLGCSAATGELWSPPPPRHALAHRRRTAAGGDPRTATAAAAVADGAAADDDVAAVTAEHGLNRLLQLHRGGASLTTISAALNKEGFRRPTGQRWHRTSVARVIHNVAYPPGGDERPAS